MEPLYFVMAIMGCGDGTANCAEARVESVHYATVQQCQAAMPAAGNATGRGEDEVDMRPANRTNLGCSCEPATKRL